MGTRSKAKKEQDKWKAVAADMKKKGPGAISGRTTPPPPPPRMAPKPPVKSKPKAKPPVKAPEKPTNKRTGQDYRDWADLKERIRANEEKKRKARRTLPGRI